MKCCKGCTERRVTVDFNCHTDCERFNAEKAKHDADKAREREIKAEERALFEYYESSSKRFDHRNKNGKRR